MVLSIMVLKFPKGWSIIKVYCQLCTREDVEKMLVELSASGQNQILQALYGKVKEIYEQLYDVITIEAVEALKRDVRGNMSPSVKAEIELGYFVVEMHGIQRYYQRALLVFIGDLLGIPQVITSQDNVEVEDSIPVIKMSESTSNETAEIIVKGVGGLARYLGIGNTKAQEILNSKILQKHKGTAYLVGNEWRINTEKLDELLDVVEKGDIIVTKNFSRFMRNPIVQQGFVETYTLDEGGLSYVFKLPNHQWTIAHYYSKNSSMNYSKLQGTTNERPSAPDGVRAVQTEDGLFAVKLMKLLSPHQAIWFSL